MCVSVAMWAWLLPPPGRGEKDGPRVGDGNAAGGPANFRASAGVVTLGARPVYPLSPLPPISLHAHASPNAPQLGKGPLAAGKGAEEALAVVAAVAGAAVAGGRLAFGRAGRAAAVAGRAGAGGRHGGSRTSGVRRGREGACAAGSGEGAPSDAPGKEKNERSEGQREAADGPTPLASTFALLYLPLSPRKARARSRGKRGPCGPRLSLSLSLFCLSLTQALSHSLSLLNRLSSLSLSPLSPPSLYAAPARSRSPASSDRAHAPNPPPPATHATAPAAWASRAAWCRPSADRSRKGR